MGEIRKHAKEDNIKLSGFLDKYFPRTAGSIVRRSRSPEYFEWKYGRNPFGETIVYHYWNGNEIMGTFGGLPKFISIRGKRILSYHLVDAFVAPQLQGQGVFRELGDLCYSEVDRYTDVSYAMDPMKISATALIKRYSCYFPFSFRQTLNILNLVHVLESRKLNIIAPIGMLANIVKDKFIHFQKLDIQEIKYVSESLFKAPDEDIDFSLIRDAQYFSYRYIDCPEPYRFFVIHSNQISCVLVVKFVQWQGLTICYLVDVIGQIEFSERFFSLAQSLYTIGSQNLADMVFLEVPEDKKLFTNLRWKGLLIRKRPMHFVVRQAAWPFLHPSSPDFDSSKWVIYPGDTDVM